MLRLTLLHSERPKLHGVLTILSAIGLSIIYFFVSHKHLFFFQQQHTRIVITCSLVILIFTKY